MRPLPARLRERPLIIHNAAAGTSRRRLLTAVVGQLHRRGATITVKTAHSVGENARLAREAVVSGGHDVVVAAGGDSTIRGTAMGLLDSPLPLGVIPVGTGNVLAAEIGLKQHADIIADYLMTGPAKSISGGLANGEPFFLMAGAGFDGGVIANLNDAVKRRVGKFAYTIPVMKALGRKLPDLSVEVDGVSHHARWVIVAKAKHYGGAFVLSPSSSLSDQGFTTILFRPATRLGLARQLLRLSAGRLEGASDVTFLRGNRIGIASHDDVPVQIDGEPFGSTPLVISTDERRLFVVTPISVRRGLG